MASEATIFIVIEDVNDEIPLFTEREQERVLEGEPIGKAFENVLPRLADSGFFLDF